MLIVFNRRNFLRQQSFLGC